MAKVTKKVFLIILTVAIVVSSVFAMASCKKEDDEPQILQGEPGADGITPHIGENGNWWIGEVDTGVCAVAQNGSNGVDGKDGTDGKDGAPGKDGVDGTPGVDGQNGKDGTNGKDGKDGVSVTSCVINDKGELVVSYSNGKSENLGGVVGEDGANGKNGVGITGININQNGELIITLSDSTKNLGCIVGSNGEKGSDGVGVENAYIDNNGNLVIILTDGTMKDLGCVVGKDGETGPAGAQGNDGATPKVKIDTATSMWMIYDEELQDWKELGVYARGEDGKTPEIQINSTTKEWEILVGGIWKSTGVKAEGTDGKNGVDGRGIKKMEIKDGFLWVTYTDSNIPENIGKVTAESEGGESVTSAITDIYTDALDFYPINGGTEYGVMIGRAIYLEEIVIPSIYNGKPVTAILEMGFGANGAENVILRSVILPSTITKICSGAFMMCPNLDSLTIPKGVTEIGESALNGIDVVIFEIAENEVPEDQDWTVDNLYCGAIIWKG